MKKSIFTLLCGVGLLTSLSSCDDNKTNQPVNTQRYRVVLCTAIMPDDESAPVQLANDVNYNFTYDMMSSSWDISMGELNISNLGNLAFTSPTIFASGSNNITLSYNTPFTSNNGQTISNIQALLISDYYWPGITSTVGNLPAGILSKVNYKVNNQYTVTSFPSMVSYKGTTESKFNDENGNPTTATNKDAYYTVNLKLSTMTATIIIHNAKFAPGMPNIARMTLNDLKITTDREYGYVVSGTDIIPTVGEGAGEVPYPMFTFNNIRLHPVDSYMEAATCEFTVAGKFEGSFTGKWYK